MRKGRLIVLAAGAIAAAALSSAALIMAPEVSRFSGELAFAPEDCKAKRACALQFPLIFVDAAKRVWRADAGALTDGASIPDWAQIVIGGPWDPSYLKAAILHDQYCDSRKASWRATHLMFYEVLVALGVSEFKAKVMYYAVYVGGPKWLDGLTAESCPSEGPCDRVKGMMSRPERFGEMDMRGEMRRAEDFMIRNPDASLRDLEDMAKRTHPDDMFFGRSGGSAAEECAGGGRPCEAIGR